MQKTPPQDLTLRAANGIKDLLFSNEMNPSLRLNARDLSRQLDMSPTPVVQALKLLHFQGILGHVPNKGYFVETNTPEMIRDIFNLRMAVESAGLETFMDRVTHADRRELEGALKAHMEALKKNSAKQVLKADMSFHIRLARVATGSAGERVMRNLFEMLYLKNREVVLYITPKEQFGSHHREILDYLWAGETANARTALVSHLTSVRDAVLSRMEADGDETRMNW